MCSAGNRVGQPGEPVRSRLVDVAPGTIWSTGVVLKRLEHAAAVLMDMRAGRHAWPSSRITAQHDVVRSFWDAYGSEAARLSRVMPSGRDIDRADEALGWLLWLEPGDVPLVFGRALGVKWRHLVRRLRMSERGLRTRHRRAVFAIVLRLNA